MARRFASVNVGQCSTNPGDGPECVVTSGKGAIPISYKGQTDYVYRSGFKEAFDENPERTILEFRAIGKRVRHRMFAIIGS